MSGKKAGSDGQVRKTTAEWAVDTKTYLEGMRLMDTDTGVVRVSKGTTYADAWTPSSGGGATTSDNVTNESGLVAGATLTDALDTLGTAIGDHETQITGLGEDLASEITNRNAAIAAAVVGLFDYRGNYDASGNTFPAAGGSGTAGAILKGDIFRISVAGTLGGESAPVGALVAALIDTPGQTAGNWDITDANVVNAATAAALALKLNLPTLNGAAQTKMAALDGTVSGGTITFDLTATTPVFASARVAGWVATSDGQQFKLVESETTVSAFVVAVKKADDGPAADGDTVRVTFIGT